MLIKTLSSLGAAIAMQLPSGPALEELYWDCDYAATSYALDLDTGALCTVTMEKLKAEKFDGSYPKFIEWWKQQKAAEHEKRKNKPRE